MAGPPSSKKKKLEASTVIATRQTADFYYFGLHFCHTCIETGYELPSYIPFQTFKEFDNAEQMKVVIQDDVRKLNRAKMGGKENYKANEGKFKKLLDAPGSVYVYQHNTHATCSSTLYRDLSSCFVISTSNERIQPCTDTGHHLCLEPFYGNNLAVLSKYENATSESIAEDIRLLWSIVNDRVSSQNTKFSCPSDKLCSWSENVYSLRLSHGIQTLLPDRKIHYTAPLGLSWETEVLPLLGITCANSGCFLFRGAPDIIISKKYSIVSGQNEQESSSSEDEVIENSFQHGPMHGDDMPEKVGEVFAGLHLLLVSKVLRRLYKKKPIFDVVLKVKGILIDKISGAYHCSISVQMNKEKKSSLYMCVVDYGGYLLSAEILCAHLMALDSGT